MPTATTAEQAQEASYPTTCRCCGQTFLTTIWQGDVCFVCDGWRGLLTYEEVEDGGACLWSPVEREAQAVWAMMAEITRRLCGHDLDDDWLVLIDLRARLGNLGALARDQSYAYSEHVKANHHPPAAAVPTWAVAIVRPHTTA